MPNAAPKVTSSSVSRTIIHTRVCCLVPTAIRMPISVCVGLRGTPSRRFTRWPLVLAGKPPSGPYPKRLVRKPQRVSQRRAFDDFVRPLIVSRKFHANAEIGAAIHQQLRHGKPPSSNCVTAWKMAVCPPTPASSTVARALTSAPRSSSRCAASRVAELRGHVQQRRSLKQEAAAAVLPQSSSGNRRCTSCGSASSCSAKRSSRPTEHCQHARRVVPGRAAGLEQQVDAGAQSLRRPRRRSQSRSPAPCPDAAARGWSRSSDSPRDPEAI